MTLLFIDRVLCDRPCALPMDDSFAYRRSIWTFGSRHTDDPYGQTWDVIFAIQSVAPSSNGRPKILLGFNVHLCGSDQKNIFFYYLFFLYGATCHDFLGWLVASIIFFKGLPRVAFLMAGVASLTLLLGPINRYILFLALHLSHNPPSAISSKGLV